MDLVLMDSCLYVLSFLLILVFGRNAWWKFFKRPSPIPAKTMVVLGSGGHTREMIEYVNLLCSMSSMFSPRIYIYSKNDELSKLKAERVEAKFGLASHYYDSIMRAREVGQSWLSSCVTTAMSIFHSVILIFKWRPDAVICNGPGVCVPICLVARLVKLAGLKQIRILFLESICRVESLSLTGHIMRYVADLVLVQWEDLATKYPGTKYIPPLPSTADDL